MSSQRHTVPNRRTKSSGSFGNRLSISSDGGAPHTAAVEGVDAEEHGDQGDEHGERRLLRQRADDEHLGGCPEGEPEGHPDDRRHPQRDRPVAEQASTS